jgi:parallel beta-helix repeat protein/predicted outer membrane repeat protein
MTINRPARRASPRLRVERLEDRAVPATFNVTTALDGVTSGDGRRSLREAITAANSNPGADVIVVPAGVFRIALAGAGEDANLTGDFDVTGAVTIRGAGAGLTVIDGQQLDRVFDVFGTAPGSIAVLLQGVAVRNGNVTGHGGGVQVGNANLVVRDGTVTGNRASLTGGGVSNGAAPGTENVTLVRTTVGRNVAGTDGGGLSVFGTSVLTLRDSTVRRNVAASSGGGISAGTATLTNSTVSGNIANVGGGIRASTANLTNSTVSGNSAAAFGGGIRAETATLTGCTVSGNTAADGDGGGIRAQTATLTNCTVSGNTATDGGGIIASVARLTNSTVSGNTAGSEGGGVDAFTATLLNCTVVENIAHTGGGLFHNPGGGTFSVRNTLIALNLVDFAGAGPDVSGEFTSQGHNLIGIGTGGTGFTGVGDIVGTSANPIDPKLGTLANNGGRTMTHALLAGSRAIDRGDNAGVPASDQRGPGFPRKKDGNGDGLATVDIGAFER